MSLGIRLEAYVAKSHLIMQHSVPKLKEIIGTIDLGDHEIGKKGKFVMKRRRFL